ncbi:MAG: substrate-binding domain-containing protein [Planctomycetes bacterium]|nr:substrate-binding domain-containing protein [Planctomycetota bacterium]
MNLHPLTLFFFLFSATVLPGCGSGEDGGNSGARSEKYEIAVIPKGTSHEFWKSVHSGARKAECELPISITWMGPSKEDDRIAQIEVVDNFISKGVDGIVISPLDDTALVPVLKEAKAEGIPVVIVDSGVNWDEYASFVATDNRQGGVVAAQHLGKLLDGKGKVIMMRYFEGSASTSKREVGFLETIAEDFPEIEVVSGNQFGGATSDECYQTAENLLINHQDIDGIFCACEPTTFGMLRALQDSDLAGKVRFVGFDATDKLLDGLRAGEIDGLVLQDPFGMGELAVKRMVDHLDGKPVDKFVDTGVNVATQENVDTDEMRALWSVDFDKWLK